MTSVVPLFVESMHTDAIGDVRCPECGDGYCHIGPVVIDQGRICIRVGHERCVTTTHNEPKDRRGSVVRIEFVCEQGHKFFWELTFHKGNTPFRLIVNEAPGVAHDTLWRD